MTDKQKAIIRYNESGIEKEEQSPLERLRFFCSLAMSGDDWLDAEMFFDSLALQVRDKVDVGPWSAGTTSDGRAYLDSSDFNHDVRLYVDGDFAWPGDKLNYAKGIARQLNAAPVSAEPVGYVSQQAINRLQDGRHADVYPTIEELKHEFFDAIPMAVYTTPVPAQAQQPVSGADQFRDAAQMIEPSGNSGELPASVEDALDLMDAILAPERGLLAVPYTSATVTAAREDMALIRAALARQEEKQ